MEKRIVLVPVDYDNANVVCQKFMNKSFLSEGDVIAEMHGELTTEDSDPMDIEIFGLDEFCYQVNLQQLDVLTEYFICVVNVEEN